MHVHLQRAALAAALFASLSGVAFAADFNPQPDPPGRQIGKLADGQLAEVAGRNLLLGTSHTPAPMGRYALADGSIIFVGGKGGQITKTTSALVNHLITTGSKAMLNPQPLPP